MKRQKKEESLRQKFAPKTSKQTCLSTYVCENTVGIILTNPYGNFSFFTREQGTVLEVRNRDDVVLGAWRLHENGTVKLTRPRPAQALAPKAPRKKEG